MKLSTFLDLPTSEVARLVRQAGTSVAVFPINGTRRWFMLEHPVEAEAGFSSTYLDVIVQRHVDLYRLFFDCGIDTLLTPAFGPDLAERGEAYMDVAAEGLTHLATHPVFVHFFRDYQVRVRFYGDYAAFFRGTRHAYLVEVFQDVMARTASNDRFRLLFGICAGDATDSVASLAVRYYLEHGAVPDRDGLIELYYGEPIAPINLFIGFDKPCVFDMPLLATGNEDLYFTVSPSFYLTERHLRRILYDHLYSRRNEPDYAVMTAQDWALMRDFYRANEEKTLGIGVRHEPGDFWYPLPQIELPPGLDSFTTHHDLD